MSNVLIFGIILMVWAGIGMIGVIFQNNFKTNWCMIAFFALIPFIPFIAKFFKVS